MGTMQSTELTVDYPDHNYLTMEKPHAKEILRAFADAPKPSKRTPFWTGVVPARGMSVEHLVEAYACNNDYVKLISSTCDSCFGPTTNVPHYHCQMLISVETLKDISDYIEDREEG